MASLKLSSGVQFSVVQGCTALTYSLLVQVQVRFEKSPQFAGGPNPSLRQFAMHFGYSARSVGSERTRGAKFARMEIK